MNFYENTPEPTAPAASTAPTSSTASALYGPKPEFIDESVTEAQRAERTASVGRALYSPQTNYSTALPDDANDVFTDVPAAREVLADLHVDAAAAAELLTMMRQLPQVTEAARADWHAQSLALTVPAKGTNTPQVSAADLELARAFVARDPRVFDLLDRTGLGNHPRVLLHVTHLAREHALRGRK